MLLSVQDARLSETERCLRRRRVCVSVGYGHAQHCVCTLMLVYDAGSDGRGER